MTKIDIDEINDEELGRLIKSKIIKWEDIKKWEEELDKTQLKR